MSHVVYINVVFVMFVVYNHCCLVFCTHKNGLIDARLVGVHTMIHCTHVHNNGLVLENNIHNYIISCDAACTVLHVVFSPMK